MKKSSIFLLFLLTTTLSACAQKESTAHLVSTTSIHSMPKTVEILKAAIDEMGLTLLGEIDHAKAAAENGLELRPTYLLLFGNPQVGTKLMQADQRTGLDLPLRLLVWENEHKVIYVSYHDPRMLADSYLLQEQKDVLLKMHGVLEKLTQQVAQPPKK